MKLDTSVEAIRTYGLILCNVLSVLCLVFLGAWGVVHGTDGPTFDRVVTTLTEVVVTTTGGIVGVHVVDQLALRATNRRLQVKEDDASSPRAKT